MEMGEEKYEFGICTPACNTGVQNTIRRGLFASLDWVQGTYQATSDWRLFVQDVLLLKPEEFHEIGKGMYGWSGQAVHPTGVRVLYGGKGSVSGVHLIMSGDACREYESLHDLLDLVKRFLEKGRFTRLDLAIDDTRGYFRISTLVKYLRNGWFQSRYRKFRVMETWGVSSDKSEIRGQTVYLGSPKSAKQVRFYEKNWERINKGYLLVDGVEVWNRTEVQLRDEHANVAAYELLQRNIGDLILGMLCQDIRFCRGKGENKARWQTVQWWERFIGDVKGLTITKQMPEKTLVRKHVWIDEQVSKTLSMLWLAVDGDINLLVELLETGADKLVEADIKKIEREAPYLRRYLKFRKSIMDTISLENRDKHLNKLKELAKDWGNG